ncbi:MAG TPA: glutamine-hydrolyzing GMP synthase [Streptosporangiaceae bacterium]
MVHAGDFDTVLVVDFGAQYAQLIARRVRECHVYSEIVPCTTPAEQILARRPAAVILSGGPASVYAEGAPPAPAGLLAAGVPVLGICYGFQLMVSGRGGSVAYTGAGEYGATAMDLLPSPGAAIGGPDADAATLPGGTLLSGLPQRQQVWMSHGDTCTVAPPGFTVTARTAATPVAAVEAPGQGLYGVQFHPEVLHTEHGMEVLRRFLRAARCRPNWTMQSIIDEQVARIAKQVGGGRAICGLSGGVDSAVAAALVQRAIGSQLTCVFVDHGLLRKGEAEQVEKDFVAATGVDLHTVAAAGTFLAALASVVEPEEKRKIIGREFIRAFERATREIAAEAGAHGEAVSFLVQGTLYPDVVESGGGTGTASIKSHHNVGGLPADLGFELVEPLRGLFKDEVRRIGQELGLPPEIVWRQPFPGPGLGIRIIGEITEERLQILREADAIVREELSRAGLDLDIWQCPVVLLADIRSVGVQGDLRTYGHPVVLRPVTSEDAMTADWARLPDALLAAISTRITNEVRQINRVVIDITSKPPATIEWE